jgi:hypothetical protein
MLGANGAVWLATQAIGNDALRPSPAGQMSKLFTDEPLGEGLTNTRTSGRFVGAHEIRCGANVRGARCVTYR